MKVADYVLYTIWFLFPLFYFTITLWALLERASKKSGRDDIGDYAKQGGFLLVCVLVSIFIDRALLKDIINAVLGDMLPLGYFRAILFPVVVFIGARIIGPSKEIKIANAQKIDFDRHRKKK